MVFLVIRKTKILELRMVFYADALCFRTKQKIERYRPRIQVIKCQTIIEAITLKLRMWVYSDEVSAKHPGMFYEVIIFVLLY